MVASNVFFFFCKENRFCQQVELDEHRDDEFKKEKDEHKGCSALRSATHVLAVIMLELQKDGRPLPSTL